MGRETPELLTVQEVAAILRVSIITVRRWLQAGRLHGIKPGGRRVGWRIARTELERFLREQGGTPNDAPG